MQWWMNSNQNDSNILFKSTCTTMYSRVVQSSAFQPRVQALPNGHKINLEGREVINGVVKIKTYICIHFLDISLIFVKS